MIHRFPGLLKDKTAAGTIRWRVRVEGNRNKKIAIPVGPGEPSFHEHYASARLGEKLERVKPIKVKVGTLDALCDSYLCALEQKIEAGNASPLTLTGHKSLLKQACNLIDPAGDRMGSLNSDIPEEGFIYILDSFGSRTGAADNCIKALKAAYRWGEKRGHPKLSAVFGISKVHKSRGGAVQWTDEDFSKFMEAHGQGTMARLWLLLSINTLPRIGDVSCLGKGNFISREDGIWIEFQPSKKGSAFVAVPALSGFLDELALHGDRETFLTNDFGNQFASSKAFANKIQKWTDQAGLPKGRTQHGVRKGAAALLALSGATQYEIMSLMAHTQAKTSEVYTKSVERAALAATAIRKLSGIEF